MKNAILIHGCCKKEEFFSDHFPSGSNSHWLPWLQKQLIKQGIETQTPEMPTPYAPQYEEWKRVFERFSVHPETVLVGHSCGAGFLIRWLGESGAVAKNLLLVAPWLDPIRKRKGFLDFKIDPSVQDRVANIHILFSADDPVAGVKESVESIATALPKTKTHRFESRGHFTFGMMKTIEFPELLRLIQDGNP